MKSKFLLLGVLAGAALAMGSFTATVHARAAGPPGETVTANSEFQSPAGMAFQYTLSAVAPEFDMVVANVAKDGVEAVQIHPVARPVCFQRVAAVATRRADPPGATPAVLLRV